MVTMPPYSGTKVHLNKKSRRQRDGGSGRDLTVMKWLLEQMEEAHGRVWALLNLGYEVRSQVNAGNSVAQVLPVQLRD
jgi:hypothetical protein